MAIDHLARQLKASWTTSVKLGGHTAEHRNVLFYWPETFMNLSGKNVKRILSKKRVERENMIVIYDCLETKLGKVKVSTGTSFKGHNGLKSIS